MTNGHSMVFNGSSKPFLQLTKFAGLKRQLVVSALATVGITSILIHSFWAMTFRSNADTLAKQMNTEIARETANEVDHIFSHVTSVQQFITLAVHRGLVNLNDLQENQDFLLSLLQTHPKFTWVQIGYPNGNYAGAQRIFEPDEKIRFHWREWHSDLGQSTKTTDYYELQGSTLRWITRKQISEPIPYYSPRRPWYRDAIANAKRQTWTVYIYRTTNTPGLDSSITLFDAPDQQLLGVIGVGFELKQLSQNLAIIQQTRPGESFIINSKWDLIATSNPLETAPTQIVGNTQAQLKHLKDSKTPLLQLAAQALLSRTQNAPTQGQKTFLYIDPTSRTRYYISLSSLGFLDWSVGTVIPESFYLGKIYRSQFALSLLLLILVLLITAVVIVLADWGLVRPIQQIALAINKVEQGRDVSNLGTIAKRPDELGQLARAFQEMAQQLSLRKLALHQLNQELEIRVEKRTQELTNSQTQLQSYIEELEQVETQLTASLREKEILLKEVHHRVKNNLQTVSSLLRLQANSIENPALTDLLMMSRSRIQAMALIHEKLYRTSNLSRIDFANYVTGLITELMRSYNRPEISLEMDLAEVDLTVDTAIPCGLILNELVSNSLKYAFPDGEGQIRIQFTNSKPERFTLMVSDNGIGFPKDLDFRDTSSLGMQLVCALTQQLKNSSIELCNVDRTSQGTTFVIQFSTAEG